jgi:hypothetical protein
MLKYIVALFVLSLTLFMPPVSFANELTANEFMFQPSAEPASDFRPSLTKESFELLNDVSSELETIASRIEVLRRKVDGLKTNSGEEYAFNNEGPPHIRLPAKDSNGLLLYNRAWAEAKTGKVHLLIVNRPRSLKKVIETADEKIVTQATPESGVATGVTEVSFANEKPELPRSAWLCDNSGCRLVAPTLIGTDWLYDGRQKFWYRLVERGKSEDCKCVGDCQCANCNCSTQAPTPVTGTMPVQQSVQAFQGQSFKGQARGRCRNGQCGR